MLETQVEAAKYEMRLQMRHAVVMLTEDMSVITQRWSCVKAHTWNRTSHSVETSSSMLVGPAARHVELQEYS